MASAIKVLRALDGDSISAKSPAATALAAGLIVCLAGATLAAGAGGFIDAAEFTTATAKRGWLLEREVLNATEIPVSDFIFTPNLLSPELAGNVVSARKVQEYEVEGTELILTTTAQALSGSTALDVELTTVSGKLALRTTPASQELFGWLRAQLAAQVTGNTFRFLVEVAP